MITIINKPMQQMEEDVMSSSIDLCITSPPYKNKDGFSYELMHSFGKQLQRVLKPNALAFVNFGYVKEEPLRFKKVAILLAEYLTYVQDIIWLKSFKGVGRFGPINSNKWTNKLHEPVYVFANGDDWKLNRLAVGEEYKDASNVKRWNKEQNVRCSGDVQLFPYENKTGEDFHIHKFPDSLIEYCVKLSGICEVSNVLDTFAGRGTTLFVAHKMKMNAIGYEIKEQHCASILEKINGS